MRDLDDDRATSVVLVTDAVAPAGNAHPSAFHKLLNQYAVRVFGFLIGLSCCSCDCWLWIDFTRIIQVIFIE